jgi:hypothetical protein
MVAVVLILQADGMPFLAGQALLLLLLQLLLLVLKKETGVVVQV